MIAWIIVSIAYIAAQMLSDIGSLQIVAFTLQLGAFPLHLSMDAGTFIYPITFTLRDIAHKVVGLKGVRVLIISAAVINLFMALYFWFVASLPPDQTAGSSLVWGQVLSPIWRITAASILAEVVSELVDTESYRLWMERVTKRFQWLRVLVSNSISIPIDTLIFTFLAFYGTMPLETVMSIFWANILVKGLVTVGSLWMIYLVKDVKA